MTIQKGMWAKIGAGILLGGLVSGVALKVQQMNSDCCAVGAECCKPGAACCNKLHASNK